MPTVIENKRLWNDQFHWSHGGHEWSAPWGTAADQWHSTILRRIFALLPTDTILEIAPGFGRWTPYLIDCSYTYVGIDISQRCVSHCRRTFGPLNKHPRFVVGNGTSLEGIADGSVSFAFSFDSLVHVEMDCLAAYICELGRVLKPGGHAFLHHSNLGEYVTEGQLTVPNHGWRATTVTAEGMKMAFQEQGFISLAHEKVKWVFDSEYCDCFTLVRKPDRRTQPVEATTATVFYNDRFSEELASARFVSERYTAILGAGEA